MSTRSGRRIHKPEDVDEEKEIKSTQSTRSRRQENVENINMVNVSSNKNKKRQNYVSYPTDDENCESIKAVTVNAKPLRRRKKDILVQVVTNQDVEPSADEVDSKPAPRTTRRTRRFADENQNENQPKEEVPAKKNKRNKAKNIEATQIVLGPKVTSKKSLKKKGKSKKACSIEETEKSEDSMYHSAASRPCSPELESIPIKTQGDSKWPQILISPCSEIDRQIDTINKSAQEITENISDKLNGTFEIKNPEQVESKTRVLVTPEVKNSRRLTQESSVLDSTNNNDLEKNSTPNKSTEKVFLTPEVKTSRKLTRQSSVLDSTYNNDLEKNSTPNKSTEKVLLTPEVKNDRRLTCQSPVLDSTYDNDIEKNSTPNKSTEKVLLTSEVKTSSRLTRQSSVLDSTYDNDIEKNPTPNKSTEKVNSTYEKINNDSFDILNTTPILVDSSSEDSVNKSLLSSTLKPPETPLKREGTFTKDGPDPIIILSKFENGTPSNNLSTPTKICKSLQSPGRTPYPSNKKERILNARRTRPVERNSLTSDAPRLTKVAFCSPGYNINLANERKSKIIKSNIKGSNKSFLFEMNDSVAEPASRKRSYTANDVDEKSAKRKKTLEERQVVFDRLSRPRSLSAQPKLTDQTPKNLDPAAPKSQPRSRSKVPNFAALHEENFSKMESLDECVERKKRRAKRLLVPTGGVTVLERSSPQPFTFEPKSTTKSTPVHTEPLKLKSKPKESIKNTEKNTATTDVSTNTKCKKLEVSTDRKPGYTRFGFKVNSDVNPFSITNDTIKEIESKQNSLKRELTAPSLNTSVKLRKEVVKNILNREKSSGNLRGRIDEERKEARTIIKGVRSNRRFELQMKMRKLN